MPTEIEHYEIEADINGEERWEMFPDKQEQEALKTKTPEQLARHLWANSNEFVFIVALPEIARNLSVDKAVEIVQKALEIYPLDKEKIQKALKITVSSLNEWSEYNDKAKRYSYTEEQIRRNSELRDRLSELIE